MTSQVLDELVDSCPSGQLEDCGPCPPLFAHVVVVVVVVVDVNPPFTGSSVVDVEVLVFGGLAKAAGAGAIAHASIAATAIAAARRLTFLTFAVMFPQGGETNTSFISGKLDISISRLV